MTLGSDVSRLSTTTAGAPAQGLSIVVPLYNEAAGLALLHGRLVGLARTLKARYGLESEVRARLTLTRSTSRWCRCRAISARRPR